MKLPVVSKVTFGHWSGSVGLASFAWFAVTGEVLRDLAAIGSILVSAAALSPSIRAYCQKAIDWIGRKL